MPSLAEVVDVVLGVDTHKHTHTATVIDATTGTVLDDLTVHTGPDGCDQFVAMADRHSGLRAWSIEGTGGYGAGLTRHLHDLGEVVIELDRPNRPARRNGAKSDPLDAVRAGREALTRDHLAQPRAEGEQAALAVLLAARRSAVDASTVAQCQLHSLAVAAPEALRSRFRGQTTPAMITTAARLRINASWDVETATYATMGPPRPGASRGTCGAVAWRGSRWMLGRQDPASRSRGGCRPHPVRSPPRAGGRRGVPDPRRRGRDRSRG